MKILITGSTGFLGSALTKKLKADNHIVYRLIRSPQKQLENDISWNPENSYLDDSKLSHLDAVIHLSGENIAAKWTKTKKKKIYDSRIHTTSLLARTLAQLSDKPKVFAAASATGYYGNRPGQILTERSAPGKGFLADLCSDWEAAAEPARNAGIRTVHLRFGMILHPEGGALKKMLPMFKLALAGPLGDGKQYWSWITLEDTIAAIKHIINNPSITGPVNIVAPNPLTNKEFTKALAHVLKRPAFIPAPRFLLKLTLGQFALETLLPSSNVQPEKLMQTDFPFKHPTLEPALRAMLTPVKNQQT
jgi:uncharacterized protein (TIGR01777 family)